MQLRHEHEDTVAANFHSRVWGHHCMEHFVIEDNLEEISTFVGRSAPPRTLTIDYSVRPVDDFGPLADMDRRLRRRPSRRRRGPGRRP